MTSSPEPPPRRSLDRDELVAVLVAFGTLGTIFFWSIRQNDPGFDLSSLTGLQSPSPTVSVSPSPTATNAPITGTQPFVAPTAVPVAPSSPPPSSFQAAPVPLPAPAASPAPSASPSPSLTAFSDVPTSYWAAPYIVELTRRGILQGFPDGTFQPNKPITRAEFAGIVSKAFDKPGVQQSLAFGDLPTNYWAKGAIDEAVQTGFLNGYPGRIFRPGQTIPLAQLQVALATGLNLKSGSGTALAKYEDANEVPKWATDKVAAAVEAGLVTNYPDANKLTPNRGATRADAAALIYEALANEGTVEKIQQPVN